MAKRLVLEAGDTTSTPFRHTGGDMLIEVCVHTGSDVRVEFESSHAANTWLPLNDPALPFKEVGQFVFSGSPYSRYRLVTDVAGAVAYIHDTTFRGQV